MVLDCVAGDCTTQWLLVQTMVLVRTHPVHSVDVQT